MIDGKVDPSLWLKWSWGMVQTWAQEEMGKVVYINNY